MWYKRRRFEVIGREMISAVYFGLMKGGYEYYAAGKGSETVKLWERWRDLPISYDPGFFKAARQLSITAYPYWPRAAMLEEATFFLNEGKNDFQDLNAYKASINVIPSLQDRDRNQDFWSWVHHFPTALEGVMESQGFRQYIQWEQGWIKHQAKVHAHDVRVLDNIISYIIRRCDPGVKKVSVVLCPLKCTFAADYKRLGDTFYAFVSEFRKEAVLHEFLHMVIHPLIQKNADAIVALRNLQRLNLDNAYYLDQSEQGRLNALEEHAVRELSDLITDGKYKTDLQALLMEIIKSLS